MKKGLAIVLLFVFLFNVGGHYLVFWGLRFQTQQTTDWIEEGRYAQDEVAEIRIPISLPYPVHEGSYERLNGSFEHAGEFFRLIKHKFESDTAYILYVRDIRTEQLVDVMNDYLDQSQSAPTSPANNGGLTFLGKLFTDFYWDTPTIVSQVGYSLLILFDGRHELFNPPTLSLIAPPPWV